MAENSACTLPVPVSQTDSSSEKAKRFNLFMKMMIGFVFLSGLVPTEVIAQHFGCSPQYVRRLGRFVTDFFDDFPDTTRGFIVVTPNFIDKAVIALSVICQASLEDVSRTIQELFNYPISTWKVSMIRRKYAAVARDFNNSIRLDNIWVVCSDEIFCNGKPVLVSVCPKTTFILDMLLAPNRKAATWEFFMRNLTKYQGLKLTLSISDAGAGLRRGIKDAFNEAFIQNDVFHNLKELGGPIFQIVRGGYAFISELYKKQEAMKGPRPRESTREALCKLEAKSDAFLDNITELEILLDLVRELLGFAHYSKQDVKILLQWCMDEMKLRATDYPKLRHAIHVFEKRLDTTLSYLDLMFLMMDALAIENKLDPHILRMMYLLDGYSKDSDEYKYMSRRIDKALGNRRADVQKMLDALIDSIVRCSSFVENVNSRLRPAFNDMRGMNNDMLELFHTYFNTKDYRRSEIPERVGKSPLELYNGDTRRFFEIIMPEENNVV